jgi:hypothetical protein
MRREPVYDHEMMRKFYEGEVPAYDQVRTLGGWATESLVKIGLLWMFYVGSTLGMRLVLSLPLVMFPQLIRDRRIRFLLLAGAVSLAGILAEVFFLVHYAAAVTSLILALVLQSMRHLRVWRWEGRPTGLFLSRALPVLMVATLGLALRAAISRSPIHFVWDAERLTETRLHRSDVLAQLESEEGTQLAIVRYTSAHQVRDEWVYNGADIDGAKVIWARDMGATKNQELIDYFKNRRVWLVEADEKPPRVSPYPSSGVP